MRVPLLVALSLALLAAAPVALAAPDENCPHGNQQPCPRRTVCTEVLDGLEVCTPNVCARLPCPPL